MSDTEATLRGVWARIHTIRAELDDMDQSISDCLDGMRRPRPTRPDPVSPTRYPPPAGLVRGVFIFLVVLIAGLVLRVTAIEWWFR